MINKLSKEIILSIIITILLIFLVNVGSSIILEEPQYSDYCEDRFMEPRIIDCLNYENNSQEDFLDESNYYNACSDKYDEIRKPYNQNRYYIFASIGFILLICGLFAKENLFQITGLATGGVLVMQGIVMNFENKIIVFISLLVILVVFSFLGIKTIKK